MKRLSLLLVSDGAYPLTTTGFGRVSAALLTALCEGYDVWHLALGGVSIERIAAHRDRLPEGLKVIPTSEQDRAAGIPGGQLALALSLANPDVVLLNCDPGMAFHHMLSIRTYAPTAATVGYLPIEGEPMQPSWTRLVRDEQQAGDPEKPRVQLDALVVATEYASNVVMAECGVRVPWAWYGIDHSAFKQPTSEERGKLRQALGWSDRYVVMAVSANVGRKQHPRMLEAIARVRTEVPEVLFYDHTVPFNRFYLDGHDLPTIARQVGAGDCTQFNGAYGSRGYGHYFGVPDGPGNLNLADYYRAADCFLHLSSVEGFGLPLAEAMACGLPVVTVPYAAGWEVAGGAALGVNIVDWGRDKSGTRMAHASPSSAAKAITTLARNRKRAERASAAGTALAARYTWDAARTAVMGAINVALWKHGKEDHRGAARALRAG